MEDPKFTEEMFRSAPLDAEDGAGRQAYDAIVKALRDLKQSGKLARGEDETLLAEVLWTAVHGAVSLKLIYPAFPTNSTRVLVDKMIHTLTFTGSATKIGWGRKKPGSDFSLGGNLEEALYESQLSFKITFAYSGDLAFSGHVYWMGKPGSDRR